MLTNIVSIKQGFSFKKCPRCGGNIFIDKDIHGWYEQCLQCGRSSDLPEVDEFFWEVRKGGKQLTEVSKS